MQFVVASWSVFPKIRFGFSLKITSRFVNLARIISCTEKMCRLN